MPDFALLCTACPTKANFGSLCVRRHWGEEGCARRCKGRNKERYKGRYKERYKGRYKGGIKGGKGGVKRGEKIIGNLLWMVVERVLREGAGEGTTGR